MLRYNTYLYNYEWHKKSKDFLIILLINKIIFNSNVVTTNIYAKNYYRQTSSEHTLSNVCLQIVILEENQAVDSDISSVIHQVLEKEFSCSTVLIIARRVRSVLSCDHVLVIDNGKLLEFDKPSSLLADQSSHLNQMLVDDADIK